MADMVVLVVAALFLAMGGSINAAVVEHTFLVSEVTLRHLCRDTVATVVNGQLPGPALEVTEGDSVVVHVVNQSPFGVTIHWHGVKQRLTCWADGAGMVTQCPIAPNTTFTYRFDVVGQEGTLWWHAHISTLRATMHGAIVIRPKSGSYPFPKPHQDVPIVIADFWQNDLRQVQKDLELWIADGDHSKDGPASATINGKIGDLYNCSGVAQDDTFVLDVEPGKTYMLRLANAALSNEYYFKVAGHRLTVVGSDANYLRPYNATGDVVAIAPGETLDVLMVADAPPCHSYYMVALGTQSPPPAPQTATRLARGIVRYPNSHGQAMEPQMPDQHDRTTSFHFHGNMTGYPNNPLLPQVRGHVHDKFFLTLGMGTIRNHTVHVANINNVSFHLPQGRSLLEARYHGAELVTATEEMSARPPLEFDYTDPVLINFFNRSAKLLELEPSRRATTMRHIAYNSTVEVVFQSTTLMEDSPNPMHLHGHDFFVLAQGIGNYDAARDTASYNLVDPPVKNTVMVTGLGWAAVRFVADNPGNWFLHCHYEFHMGMGMATVFEVGNGPTPETALPPPPADLPRCDRGIAYE
ncbi:hypothetical protein QYE76_017988 [Lolium multiflorum]|uniref:laccase n=1 Tax=Lolium multiflorum TaxID=4521 RepID=A0AAD8QG05_LOLMU|nr:hypothetical protein QYE76_017988 [Lolium multiflorum]